MNGKGCGGTAQLYVDDKLVGQAEIPYTMPLSMGLGAGASVGCDPGSPTIPDYKPPYEFTGKLYTVTVDVSGDLIKDDEAAMRSIMARQ